ncbi:hypothetical protein Tco_0903569 [Tanacetum coccineum]
MVSDDCILRRLELTRQLHNINEMEAKDSIQKAKVKWAIEGDENSKFFHLLQGQAADLERCVSRDEIRMAVWSCGDNKSPGPDGFTFEFFKKLDSVITDLVFYTQFAFVDGRQILDGPFIINEILHWCKRKKKHAIFAKASILVNGSPSNEFSFHCGLRQGDHLSLYLFILVMESLHLSFLRVVDEGLFKGILLPGSISSSHLFYADDAMFIREWSNGNLRSVMVGECMSRHKAWADIVLKLRSHLSKWKVKTLSIGGRLTLLKTVLGGSPLYSMSIFKVPRGVLKVMEAIRNRFCNGVDPLDKKITWAAWDKVLASKKMEA